MAIASSVASSDALLKLAPAGYDRLHTLAGGSVASAFQPWHTDRASSVDGGFTGALTRALDQVNAHDWQAHEMMEGVEAGADNLVETVLAMQKAARSMQLLLQARNRLVEGYHELFNQPV